MGFALADLVSGGPPDYAAQAQAQEDARQARIGQGRKAINRAFSGFTPAFYDKAYQSYLDNALPQFAQQYNYTKGQVGFNLANRGMRKSSAATSQWNDLARQTAVGKQALVDQALGAKQGLIKDVEGSRNALISQLYQSADPAGAAADATSAAAGFQVPSSFAPIANQFSGLVNQYYLSQILNPSRPASPSAGSTGSPGYGSSFAPLPAASLSVS